MKIKYFEYIVIYLSVLIVCFLIGGFGRFVSIQNGADEFTAQMSFWICTGLSILAFAVLIILLHEFIERIVKFFFKKKGDESEPLQEQITPQNIEAIRAQQFTLININNQSKIEMAVNYTKKQFALYTKDEDLRLLCDYVTMYAEKIDSQNIRPIKVKELASSDIYHFGWNIWNHFKIGKQEQMAQFLKTVFAECLKDVEIESIKKHLKDDELKGIIKIVEELNKV